LLLGRIDAILKHFQHARIICLDCSVVKFSLRGCAAGFSSP
jgi:hypothetical protein